ncbi:MAG: alcohol dehydrogenase catalytic domain-containing protein [Corallococcus sp.]|nr:alcohol dehydrogenase catalytic domain-containing protein [Bacillota bacterium]MCM1533095.1 alcohol dehydrogenase catalytic domain-containing protein [Corallococcus sp.]
MKAWILEEPKKLRLQEFGPTLLTENKVKVKIEEILLSTSDYNIYSGAAKRAYPFVFGRNAVGVVSDVGDKDSSILQKMDRVAIEPYIPCDMCDECRDGDIQNCSNMQELGHNCNGLLQNFIDLPYALLHKLPDNLSTERALFVSYVAFCLNIADALNLEKGRHIAIFSSSKTGLILAQLVAYYQAVPVFISNVDELLDMARDLGIFYCFNPDNTDVEHEIMMITGGRMCSELVYLSDSDFKMQDVYNAAAVNANICLAGYSEKESKLSVAQICKKHLKVFGVYNGAGNYSSAINLLVTNTVNVDMLLGDVIDFASLDKALESVQTEDLLLKSKIIKVN